VIVAHHGGEASLLPALLAAAGSLSVSLALFRVELVRLGRRLRRRQRHETEKRGGER
jgi:hypothetical protein